MTSARVVLRLAAVARPVRRAAAATYRGPAIVDAVRIVAWLSITAGLIHAVAMIDHFDPWWAYGVFFMALTYGQVLWGIALLRGHGRPASFFAALLGGHQH